MSGKEQERPTRQMLEKGLGTMKWRPIKSLKRRSGCPDEAVLAAYADGTLDEGERCRAEEHLADCSACLQQVELLVRLSRQTSALEPVPAELAAQARSLAARPASRSTVGYWLPAAAAALIIVAILSWAGFQKTPSPLPERVLRSSQDAGEIQVVTPQPKSALRPPFEIAWKPVPQAVSYTVVIVTSEGEPVWQSQTGGTQIGLPRDLQLRPDAKYFLRVKAQVPGGRELASPYIAFVIRKSQ